jgi:hypothetical protein
VKLSAHTATPVLCFLYRGVRVPLRSDTCPAPSRCSQLIFASCECVYVCVSSCKTTSKGKKKKRRIGAKQSLAGGSTPPHFTRLPSHISKIKQNKTTIKHSW